jgi:hypothetical protein
VAIGANKSKFSSAVTSQGRISVAGGVKAGLPFLTRIGSFDVDLALEVGAACLGVGFGPLGPGLWPDWGACKARLDWAVGLTGCRVFGLASCC